MYSAVLPCSCTNIYTAALLAVLMSCWHISVFEEQFSRGDSGKTSRQTSKIQNTNSKLLHHCSLKHSNTNDDSLQKHPTQRFWISVSWAALYISHFKKHSKLELSALFHSSRLMSTKKKKKKEGRFLAQLQCCLLMFYLRELDSIIYNIKCN